MCFFFGARTEKGIARHIDASCVIWTLIDNGKLANQIARLAAIVIKDKIYRTSSVCAKGWDLVIFDWFVLSMRKQVILDSLYARPGSAPIAGGKKG